MKEITYIIDDSLKKEYLDWYFNEYPKRKVDPLKNGVVAPSLNAFIAMKRMEQNSVKQKYKEFGLWIASKFNFANLQAKRVTLKWKFFMGDRRRRDLDNMILSNKFYADSFVEGGLIDDDDSGQFSILLDSINYDKEHPRIELTVIIHEQM